MRSRIASTAADALASSSRRSRPKRHTRRVPGQRPPRRRPTRSTRPSHRPLARDRLCGLRLLAGGLGPRRVLLVPRRREGSQQTIAGDGTKPAFRPGRPAAHEADDDPSARYRLRPRRGEAGTAPFGLDHARATDPDHHRLYYLSIPRDLWVDIQATAADRINTAYRPVAVLALPHHPRLHGRPDRSRCRRRLQALRGADRPTRGESMLTFHTRSSRTGSSARTSRRLYDWTGGDSRRASSTWTAAGPSSTRAFARTASTLPTTTSHAASGNSGHAGDRRQTRGRRDVPAHAVRRRHLLAPLATDLSASEFLQLGWVKFRAGGGSTIHCRLGGDPETIGGASVIRSSEENRNVISMFLNESAPQPPRPDTGSIPYPAALSADHPLGSR